MTFDVTLPRQSEKIDESLITFWHVSEGDEVEKGNTLVEVQTEKAVTEIEAPKSGVIKEIKKTRGDTVKVDEVIVQIELEGEVTDDSSIKGETANENNTDRQDNLNDSKKKATPRVKKIAKELGVNWQRVHPSGKNGKVTEEDVKVYVEENKKTEVHHTRNEPEGETKDTEKRRIIATPSVRKLARENDVNLEHLSTSQSSGKISKSDVEAFIAGREAAATEVVETKSNESKGNVEYTERRIPLTGIQKAVASEMVHSKSHIPQVTHFDEANVEKLVGLRQDIKGYFAEEGVKLTYLAFVVKAMSAVLNKYPYLNGSFDEKKDEIIIKEDHHIGFAADTERGLLVPVINQADKKSIFQIAKDIQGLANKAKEGTINVDEMSGGTFTISNVGSASGSFFTPIINPPQSSILGIGRIEKKAVVVDDTVKIQSMMALSLSYDHRLIDGVLAQEAMNELKKYLTEPGLLLAKV